MEYVKEISINEAIVHILDNNADEPVLNEFALELNDEIYNFILKHIDKAMKDEELKYAVFEEGRNIVKEASQEYLNGENNLLEVSNELAIQLFRLMKSNGSIPSCDLMVVSISTEYGPMLGLMKMDYIKNYMHTIDFVEEKIGINIIPQFTGLPASSQKIQKIAFIKPISSDQEFNLMVIDKQSKSKETEEYGSNYFIGNYLGCTIIENERDMTKNFLKAAEKWTQKNLKENADAAEIVRSSIKKKLKDEEIIDIKQLSDEIFEEEHDIKNNFIQFVSEQGVNESVSVDKEWVEKKLKRVRLKIDKDIDLYIDEKTYDDRSRFEIQRNGDGSINIVLKHVINYVEKH